MIYCAFAFWFSEHWRLRTREWIRSCPSFLALSRDTCIADCLSSIEKHKIVSTDFQDVDGDDKADALVGTYEVIGTGYTMTSGQTMFTDFRATSEDDGSLISYQFQLREFGLQMRDHSAALKQRLDIRIGMKTKIWQASEIFENNGDVNRDITTGSL